MFCITLALYIKQFALNYDCLLGLLQTLLLRHKLSTLKPITVDIKAKKSTNRTGLIVYIKDAAEIRVIADHIKELILYPRIVVRAEVIIGSEAPLIKKRNTMFIRNQTISQQDIHLRKSNEYTLSSNNIYPLLILQ
jgi:hypothetical protein